MFRIIRIIINRYKRYKNPIEYYRSLGFSIGEKCEIRANISTSEPYLIKIGNHVRINAGVELVTHDGGMWVLREYVNWPGKENITRFGPIEIGDNVHIGSNAIIMPNVHIGNNCIVGCGAVVCKDVPDNTIVGGVPARFIETIEEYADKHKEDICYTKQMSAKELKRFLTEKYNK